MIDDIAGLDADLQSKRVTCTHCKTEQEKLAFFNFCESCRKPLDI